MGKLEKAVYFMCQNFSSKVDWVNKLEEVIKSSPANLAPVKTGNYNYNPIFAPQPSLLSQLAGVLVPCQ